MDRPKPASLDDHVGYCKAHDDVYHGFICQKCAVGKKSYYDKILSELEDVLYFQGISPKPSKSTQQLNPFKEKFDGKEKRRRKTPNKNRP